MLSYEESRIDGTSLVATIPQGKRCRLRERAYQERQQTHLAHLAEPGLLHRVFVFLRLPEMPALWSATRGLWEWQHYDVEQLWRTLFSRRRWVGTLVNRISCHVQQEKTMLPGNIPWRSRYQSALQCEVIRIPAYVRRLQERVAGVFGLLAQYVCVKDDEDRAAACCGLRRDPLLTKDFAAGSACVVQMHKLRAESTEPPCPRRLVVVTSDCVSEDPALDLELANLRALGGTCRPLLDCYDFHIDTGLDPERLMAALRAEVGATAVCEGAEEAERIATEEHCNVVCCQGKRLAEYCDGVLPAVRWTDCPSEGWLCSSQDMTVE